MGEGRAETDDIVQEQAKERKARRACFRVWTIVGALILLVVFGYLLNILSIPVGIIIWSAIIVFCLRAPVNRLEKWGIGRGIGTAIAYLGMAVIIVGFGALLFSPVFGVGDQFANLVENIPKYVQQFNGWYNEVYNEYASFFQAEIVRDWVHEATTAFGAWASQIASSSADGIVMIGGVFANSFMVIGFSLVVAFWILMDLPALGRECRRLTAGKREQDAQMLYITFTRVMGGYLKATLIQCFLIGFACGIAYAIMGIPNAAALGGITGLLNVVPVVGPWLGGGLAAVVGVFVSPVAAIIALVVTIAIQQFVYTFVSPKLMADSVDVHPALVIIALLAGSALGGAMNGLMGSLVGMLASIPAVAALKAIFVYYFEKNTERRIVSEDGVFFKGVRGTFDDVELNYIVDAASPPSTKGLEGEGREDPRKPRSLLGRLLKGSEPNKGSGKAAQETASKDSFDVQDDQVSTAKKTRPKASKKP